MLGLKNQNTKREDSSPKLFVGLGNAGEDHIKNRHNIGFMAIDEIADTHGYSRFRAKFEGLVCEGHIDNKKVILLKPQTMMNNSGISVRACAKFFKIQESNIYVFYDELDLPFQKIKVKNGGGAAGHNGIKSLCSHLSSKDFWRIRMGIDHPGHKNKVAKYVLSDFSKKEQDVIPSFLHSVAQNVSLLTHDKQDDFMTRISEEINGI